MTIGNRILEGRLAGRRGFKRDAAIAVARDRPALGVRYRLNGQRVAVHIDVVAQQRAAGNFDRLTGLHTEAAVGVGNRLVVHRCYRERHLLLNGGVVAIADGDRELLAAVGIRIWRVDERAVCFHRHGPFRWAAARFDAKRQSVAVRRSR